MTDKKAVLELPTVKQPDLQQLLENFSKISEYSQGIMQSYMEKQVKHDHFTIPDKNLVAEAFTELSNHLMQQPTKLIEAQVKFFQNLSQLCQNTSAKLLGQEVEPVVKPDPSDKRFKADEWAEIAVFDFVKQAYLLVSKTVQQAVQEVEGLDEKTAEKVEFYTKQFVDSLAPTNFVSSNPTVLKHTLETGGENLIRGMKNMLEDLQRGKGELRIKMTDLQAFELGRNIGATPGAVVYQNDLIQLIQYTPTTETVHQTPLMIVPPWINKFYILDLKPKNSFIRWAVSQGHTVFVMSWVNPDEKLALKDFEDYMKEGPLAALEVIEKITGVRGVNAAGYCLGGTLLMSTLAYLAAIDEADRIQSATCFTCLLDFSDPGELGVFIEEKQIELIEEYMNQKGYLEGSRMAHVFSMLRANDLIWSFFINNYLLGKDPMPFDLLYWNSDSTRMPKKMHSFYLRNMYLYNKLKDPQGISLLGTPIDLRQVKTPTYFLSAREDHIAPWTSTYQGALLPSGPVKFVLGGSGHIAGVINPPEANKYGYMTNPQLAPTAEAWLKNAQQNPGSWWTDWANWVSPMTGGQVAARVPGEGPFPVLEAAPGSYVKQRIE